MKKFLVLFILSIGLWASDPITIDSLFKKQVGIRSVTTLSMLSSGNSQNYASYPAIFIQGDPIVYNDTKKLSLS